MRTTFTKKELFESIRLGLSRISPHVITEIDKPANKKMFQEILPSLGAHLSIEKIESPKWLYNFIKEHKDELIIIYDDVFSKSKNYRDIIEGAVSSSPDSGEIWPIRYLNEPELFFTGKMILCTKKTRQEIKADKRFYYLDRDCLFV